MARRCAQCQKLIHAADLAFCEGSCVHDRCADAYRSALAAGSKRRAAPPKPENVRAGTGTAAGTASVQGKGGHD